MLAVKGLEARGVAWMVCTYMLATLCTVRRESLYSHQHRPIPAFRYFLQRRCVLSQGDASDLLGAKQFLVLFQCHWRVSPGPVGSGPRDLDKV